MPILRKNFDKLKSTKSQQIQGQRRINLVFDSVYFGRDYGFFVFSDGKTDHRVWDLKVFDDNNFTGKAGDVVGIAKGEQYGNAMRMNYVLTIPLENRKINVKINDWMYLIDNDSLINVSELRKFGFKKIGI